MWYALRAEAKSLLHSFLELLCGRWMIIAGIFFSGGFWWYMTLARAPDTYGAVAQVLIRRGKLQAVQGEGREVGGGGTAVPELPDIVVYVEALEQRIVGARLEKVRLLNPFLLRTVAPPIGEAEGRTVERVRRLGKRLVLGLEGALFLVIHLMIAGRLRWLGPNQKPPGRITIAVFEFSSGRLALTEAGTKRRASLHLVADEEALRQFDLGGLEVLDAGLDSFSARLAAENHTLKRALTDPHLLGVWLLGLGLLANFLAIITNRGWMPISPETVHRILPTLPYDIPLVNQRLGLSKDWIYFAGDIRFSRLSDRFTLPVWSVYQVAYSIGDIIMAIGTIWLLWSLSDPE